MSEGGGATASRVARARSRRRKRRAVAAAMILVVAGGVWAVASAPSGGGSAGPGAGSPSASSAGAPSQVLLLAVRAEPSYLALVGSGGGRAPSIVAVPSDLVAVISGQGQTLADAAIESGLALDVGLSNTIGVWVPHYLATDLGGLATMVPSAGISIDLPSVLTLAGKAEGPGPSTLTGIQVAAYQNPARGSDRMVRWQEVLGALFHEPPAMPAARYSSTDDAKTAASILASSRGASVELLPAIPVAGLLRPEAGPDARMLDSSFGIGMTPATHLVLLNATGRTGTDALATRKLVPAGFQIVAYSRPAPGKYPITQVFASTQQALPIANRVRTLLGGGKVVYTSQTSGLADITVVLGEGFGKG